MSNLNAHLFDAARAGDTPLCLDLIERGADVNAKDRYGFGILYMAVIRGHTATCQALLGQGADPLNYANQSGHEATLLHVAVCGGKDEVCLVLLGCGIEVNAVTDKGDSPLHWACIYGGSTHENTAICAVLFEYGCNPLLKNNQGYTALDMAMECGKSGCVHIIKSHLAAGAARAALQEISFLKAAHDE